MEIHFLRGDAQTPKGHAIFIARSTQDPRVIFYTYCVIPPLPLSLGKYLPAFLAAQLPPEELREAANVNVMPIPPMLEEGSTLEYLEMLAERRDDDLCDLGTINPRDDGAKVQRVADGCQEYGQLYLNYSSTFRQAPTTSIPMAEEESSVPLDDLDAEELLLQTMTDRQRLTELGKLVGTVRYALEGHDAHLLKETQQRMRRLAKLLPDKYRASELLKSATDPGERGARLAQLYLERGFKLLDEEYADIPRIEQAIRELRG